MLASATYDTNPTWTGGSGVVDDEDYAAAGVAGTDPWETSIIAFKLGLSVFIIPYMFVYGPPLLMQGDWLEIVWTFGTACLGIFGLSVASTGWFILNLSVPERLLSFIAAGPWPKTWT